MNSSPKNGRAFFPAILCFAIFLFIGFRVVSQGVESLSQVLPNLPAPTFYHTAAWLGDDLFVQMPTAEGRGSTRMVSYDGKGTWKEQAPCKYSATGAAMVACSGKLYLIGGGSADVAQGTDRLQIYDPVSKQWSVGPPMPVRLSGHAAVNWGDSVIFVIGGPWSESAYSRDVYFYLPKEKTWGVIPESLPAGTGRRSFACGITDQGQIIITGGYNGEALQSTLVGTIEATDRIVWREATPAPLALNRCGGAACDNVFLLVGGEIGNTSKKNDRVFCYDPSTDQWTQLGPSGLFSNANVSNAITARQSQGRIDLYLAGGYSTAGKASDQFFVLNLKEQEIQMGSIPEKNQVSVFPVPFEDQVTFNNLEQGELRICDLEGKLWFSQQISDSSLQLDLSHLPSGMYFATLVTERGANVIRLIKE